MRDLVVIGFGNTLRQDDGFGPAVVERLSERVDDERILLLAPSTLTPEHAAILADTRRVVFIDACAELSPGEVARRDVGYDDRTNVSLVHFLSPEALLAWTARLYGCVPKAELWLVGTEQTGLSEELTDVVAARVDEFVCALGELIGATLRESACPCGKPASALSEIDPSVLGWTNPGGCARVG
jgi:hydrogenase maturation protease